MDLWEIDKLVIFIAFVIPGFISIKWYQLIVPGAQRATSEMIVDAIAYSSINYAILIIPIMKVEGSELKSIHPTLYSIFYISVLLIAPAIWASIWKKLREMDFFQKNAPHPTAKAWDYVFSLRKPYWVKVTLKDGTVIAGLYSSNSFASSSPSAEQIYLEETWVINERGGFERKKNKTAGVIVLNSEISHIEFRDV